MEILEKLLRLADRPGTVEEGQAALKKAQEIANKNGIDLENFKNNFDGNETFELPPYPFNFSYRDSQPEEEIIPENYYSIGEINELIEPYGFYYKHSALSVTHNAWISNLNKNFYIQLQHKGTTWKLMHYVIGILVQGNSKEELLAALKDLDFNKVYKDAYSTNYASIPPRYTEPSVEQQLSKEILEQLDYILDPAYLFIQNIYVWSNSAKNSFICFNSNGKWQVFIEGKLEKAGDSASELRIYLTNYKNANP